ncbi:acylneuraminate cytidylyltransferase family protein [Providencia rettgeri]|uniref:acylneuraminate cytidylyltransferase family protein n=1 Tax=Providencia rettgeri TaxID=587 RepID=UPI00221FDE44|nr:acylneuraminate cytidylyltransferase family protein [Providencia rettgeri]ELR5279291.1 acylneuraminate cytidylyltransferase family protein [Providencia rettgeri]ELU1436637.1 acylneuraminate cytidylyltransferase family protein [Providencia rettgeri]UYV41600.1 acylneuraminate cytidylyltransferase family protein [Providencia rettgeri]
MINNKKIIAIIPARGGSKRLPRKNILPLAGKPLINWTIEAALGSKYIDDVFVSTDDTEISHISKLAGISVPELRPQYLSTDTATTRDVILYTLNNFGYNADLVIILQPTSPLRNQIHIDEALELFERKKAFSVISVTPCEHPPQWSNTLPINNSLYNFIDPINSLRSQELEKYYRLNGAIYIYNIDKYKTDDKISFCDKSYAYIMNNHNSIDIDSAFDFDIASFLVEKK